MNCHQNNNENYETHQHNPLKHMLHMVLCCGLPIVILGLLPFISRFSPSIGRMLGFAAPFICPLMMVFMMYTMMRGKKKDCCHDKKEKDIFEFKEENIVESKII